MSTLKADSLLRLNGTVHTRFAEYAIICDQKGDTTSGGTFTTGDWRTRDLNTEIEDADSIVAISSNQFVLGVGTYLIKASAPAYGVLRHVAKLYNATASSDVQVGTSEVSHNTYRSVTRSFVQARVVLTVETIFEIRHNGGTTKATSGFGLAHNISGVNNVYTVVEIYKEV